MQIKVNIEKRHLYFFVFMLVILTGIIAVTAVWDASKNVYHLSDDVRVNIPSDGAYSLQEAVDLGKFSGSCDWIVANELDGNIHKISFGTAIANKPSGLCACGQGSDAQAVLSNPSWGGDLTARDGSDGPYWACRRGSKKCSTNDGTMVYLACW